MKLIAGSYERFLFGFSLNPPNREADAASDSPKAAEPLPLDFNYAAHLGPIKSLAVSGNVAVSGGNDDVIKIYDLKGRADMGSLMQHEGGVTCLEFHGPRGHPTHLLSGGEDSKVCVWDTDSWQHLITLKGHRGAVNDLTIHPSGRLALSVARDSSLRMWSLVQGKASFRTSIPRDGELVAFAPQAGDHYALALQAGLVGIYGSQTGGEEQQLQHPGRVLAMTYHRDNTLLTAGEESIVRAWDTRSPEPILAIHSAHVSRIRGLAVIPGSEPGPLPSLIASAASDGVVRVWDPRMVRGGSEGAVDGANLGGPQPLMEVDSKARLTCLALGGLWKGSGEEGAKGAAVEVAGLPRKGKEKKTKTTTLEKGTGKEGHSEGTGKGSHVEQGPKIGSMGALSHDTAKKKKKTKRKRGDGGGAAEAPLADSNGGVGKQSGSGKGHRSHALGEEGKGAVSPGKNRPKGLSPAASGRAEGGVLGKKRERSLPEEKRGREQGSSPKFNLTERLKAKLSSSVRSQSKSVKHQQKKGKKS